MRDSLDAVLLIAVRTVFLYTKKKSRYYEKHRLFKTSEVTIS